MYINQKNTANHTLTNPTGQMCNEQEYELNLNYYKNTF